MSFGADEEILQDFLVEAGEILEQLSEQLVELESRPDDADLLNAIFRGFHTVKGGAGFLQLNELVECCHIAENVFDILRKGERRVDSELMDVVLEALDAVNGMFSEVRERGPITPATPELLAALARLAEPAGAQAEPVAEVAAPEPVAEPVAESSSGDITDNEFELLLDSLDGAEASAPEATETQGGTARASSPPTPWQPRPNRRPPSQPRQPRRNLITAILPTTNSKPCSISCMARVRSRSKPSIPLPPQPRPRKKPERPRVT